MERRAKIYKALGHVGLSTNTAQVARVLGALRACPEEDLSEVLSATRHDLPRSLNAAVEDLLWHMSVPLADGGAIDCLVPSFSHMLQRVCQVSPALRSRLWEIWQEEPSTVDKPLSILIYGDEIVPGNVLRLDQSRKLFLLFWSIKEFGPRVLHSVDAWIPMFAMPTTKLKLIAGGISQCIRFLLRRMFLDEKINTDGVVVCLGEGQHTRVTLHFRIGNFILDGDAQRQMFCAKGAMGKVPCLCCLNVVHEDESIPSADFVSLTNTDASKLQFATSADLYEKADTLSRMAPPSMGKVRFRRLETAIGLNYVPESLLWDSELRACMDVAATVTFDSMHVLLSNGMATDEVKNLFDTIMDKAVMGRRAVTWGHLRTFVAADFHFPSNFAGSCNPVRILGTAREDRYKRDGSIGFGASEMLAIFPLITYFLELVVAPTGLAPLAIASFKALGCVVALTQRGKFGSAGAADLTRAIRVHGNAFQAAYGNSTKTKPHWLLHVPHQLTRDGWIMDAFVGERANLVAKKTANEVDNVNVLQAAVTRRCTADFLTRVSVPTLFKNRLVQPQYCAGLLESGDGWASKSFVWEGLHCREGDVILVKDCKRQALECYIVKSCSLKPCRLLKQSIA